MLATKASAFAEASIFAKATMDKPADRLRHEEKLAGGKYHGEFAVLDFPNFTAENTEVAERFSQLGVLGKLCSESKLWPQRLAFVHRCKLLDATVALLWAD